MEKICILGGGSFGTAIAGLLKEKYCDITVWRREESISKALSGCKWVISAVPAQSFREVLKRANPFIQEGAALVNLAKGIELGTLLRLSQVAEEIAPELPYAALSGPSHAEEIEQKLFTAVCVSSRNEDLAARAQQLFISDYFRVYTNDDLIGTEFGGALKNVIALASGVCDGLGLGDNSRAALMTRGIAEISRLGIKLGARQETFLGLTGIGDLMGTCCSMHSRNRRCGILLGQGKSVAEAKAEIGQTIESLSTIEAACTLAKANNVEMPISEAVYKMVSCGVSPEETVHTLMTRNPKPE